MTSKLRVVNVAPSIPNKRSHCNFTMPLSWRFLILFLSVCYCSSSTTDVFSNSFLVRFKRNVNLDEAHKIAYRNGFVNAGPVCFQQLLLYHAFSIYHIQIDFAIIFIQQILFKQCFTLKCFFHPFTYVKNSKSTRHCSSPKKPNN